MNSHSATVQDKNDGEPAVSIIVLSWNSKALLQTCLTSLQQKTSYSNCQVIVVDNGSIDNSVDWLKKNYSWVDLFVLDKNYGFPIGNNQGTAYAIRKYNPKYVLLLNNDTEIIQSDWLSKMVAVAESQKQIGIVGCQLIYADGRIQYIGTKLDAKGLSWLKPEKYRKLPQVYQVDCVLGACFLMKRSVIDRIGGLDVGFSPFGHEESDFCVRARRAGYQICMLSNVRVIHQNRASMKVVNKHFIQTVERRNVVRFMLLNFPVSCLAIRVPRECFIRPFITRGHGVLPVKLRDSKDMLLQAKTNLNGWMYNLRVIREIFQKRQNRLLKQPLQSAER